MIVGGVDTLDYSVDVDAYDEIIARYIEVFEALKAEAQEDTRLVDMCGITMKVTPSGTKNHAFGFRCEDFALFFAKKASSRNYPVWVKVYSAALWSLGLGTITKTIDNLLVTLGFAPVCNKVSRADLTVDTDELDLVPGDKEYFVRRGRKVGTYEDGHRFTGFVVGQGDPLMLRVYDKTWETKQSGKDWMRTLWAANEWYGERVWRVEFQCRRDLLREMHIETVADLETRITEIWGYLSRDWFRMKGPKGTIWRKLHETAFGEISRVGVREQAVKKNVRLLVDIGKGVLKGIGAAIGETKAAVIAEMLATYAENDMRRKGSSFEEAVETKSRMFVKRQPRSGC